MIPLFPQFKKLELSDISEVSAFAGRLPPYSDFNFVSMWLWDQNGETIVSKLNGNLVARLFDSRTWEPIYSFIGTSDCSETASELLQFLRNNGLAPELRLVPEVSVNNVMKEEFEIEEDRDNFDYVLSTKRLSSMAGARFATLRRGIRAFEKNDHEFISLDIASKTNQAKLLDCTELWCRAKNNRMPRKSANNGCIEAENIAFNKLFCFPDVVRSLTCFGLFVDGVLAGFLIGQVLNNYFLCHFGKSNYKHKGTTEFLFQQTARTLHELGISYINDEEDLGLPGLRFAKNSFRPVKFLRKYTVSFAE